MAPLCDYIEFCHLNFTTNGRSFFIHLLGESNILLKYSNYGAVALTVRQSLGGGSFVVFFIP